MRSALALVFLCLAGSAARADPPLVADLDAHFVAITAGFTGAEVTLFGSADSEGDIVVTVRGPGRRVVVRQKSHLAGLWLNDRGITFPDVPGYYATLSTRPIDELLAPAARALDGIGIDSLRLDAAKEKDAAKAARFRAAMIDHYQQAGLYEVRSGAIAFLGKHLFRTSLTFPASVPVGTYTIDVFLVKAHQVAATQTVPLVIDQSGFEALVKDFAESHPLAYGIVAALVAAVAGWLGTTALRGTR